MYSDQVWIWLFRTRKKFKHQPKNSEWRQTLGSAISLSVDLKVVGNSLLKRVLWNWIDGLYPHLPPFPALALLLTRKVSVYFCHFRSSEQKVSDFLYILLMCLHIFQIFVPSKLSKYKPKNWGSLPPKFCKTK